MSIVSQLCFCGGKDGKHTSVCPFHMSQGLKDVIIRRDAKKNARV
jgi:hypothetical protein